MKDNSRTQLVAPLAWHDPRVHLLDDTWLLTIFAAVFATAVPWLVSALAIDLVATAAGLLVLGAVHVAFAALIARHSANPARRRRALTALHTVGVLALAYIWPHVGGLQNPLFLMVFALPVIGSIFVSRWRPYAMAILAALLVALIAASEAPELRWYAPAFGTAAEWFGRILNSTSVSALPYAGFYAPSEYYVVLLEVFAILLFACAIAAEYLGTVFERLHAQVSGAWAEAERGQQLWAGLIEHLPLPAFLVDVDSSEIVAASAAALEKFGDPEEEMVGRGFFEALPFSYPEVVQELVSEVGGVAKMCMIRRGERLLATEVHVQHLAQKGYRFALIIVNETTEAFCVKAALDASEHAALVIDTRGHVLAFNRPAAALFPDTQIGTDMSSLLPQPEFPPRWWDPGLSSRRKTHVSIMQRVYQLTSSTVVMPGEDERLYVIAFLPVARTAAGNETTPKLNPRAQHQ
jgi:PAS domain-containing protein